MGVHEFSCVSDEIFYLFEGLFQTYVFGGGVLHEAFGGVQFVEKGLLVMPSKQIRTRTLDSLENSGMAQFWSVRVTSGSLCTVGRDRGAREVKENRLKLSENCLLLLAENFRLSRWHNLDTFIIQFFLVHARQISSFQTSDMFQIVSDSLSQFPDMFRQSLPTTDVAVTA